MACFGATGHFSNPMDHNQHLLKPDNQLSQGQLPSFLYNSSSIYYLRLSNSYSLTELEINSLI